MANESPLASTPAANESLPNTTNPPRAHSQQAQTPGRPGGAPARVYMNEKIVPYLLEGMKGVAKEQYVSPFSPWAGV